MFIIVLEYLEYLHIEIFFSRWGSIQLLNDTHNQFENYKQISILYLIYVFIMQSLYIKFDNFHSQSSYSTKLFRCVLYTPETKCNHQYHLQRHFSCHIMRQIRVFCQKMIACNIIRAIVINIVAFMLHLQIRSSTSQIKIR